MSALLEVLDLSVQRRGREVLRVDHLEIKMGEVLAVIGPNGAGKSTLLLVLSRLLKPDSGRILFRETSFETQNELDYRRRIALVLQEPLLLNTSVFNNVAAGLKYRRLPRVEINNRCEEWLARLGISHLKDRRAHNLSGGEAQRVSLARAFAVQPEVLLLDEPFSALDSPTRSRLLDDFYTLLEETGITTVFVTHDLDEALLLGERVAVLLEGSLRQSGRPQDVFTAPADREVAEFVGVETVLAGKVVASHAGQLEVETGKMVLEAVGDLQIGREVMLCLRPEDITLWPGEVRSDGMRMPQSSARNQVQGEIKRVSPQGPLARVLVDCGFPMVALVTGASVDEIGLDTGVQVRATFKASAVHLIPR